MTDEVVGEVLVALDAASAGAEGARTWIKITPRGKTRTRDSRTYDFDPEALEARFESEMVRVPIDFDHAIARLAGQGHSAPAIGWIEEMQARTDGLYGRVDWLEPARAALAAKTYRYLSPTFSHDADGKAKYIHSVALVTAPALSNMPALASANDEQLTTGAISAGIMTALALPATATEADALGVIAELRSAVVSLGSGGEIPQLLTDLAAARTETNSVRIKDKVEAAVNAGSIPPYLRQWGMATCSADEAGFDKLLAHIGTPLAYLMSSNASLDAATARQFQTGGEDHGEAAKIAAQLGIDPKALKTETR